MTNLKKIGLTALAGTLAATTFANAGALSVSGNAIMEYQADKRNEAAANSNDTHTEGFVMNSTLTFSGSGELDNGMTVSMYQSLASGSVTSEGVTLDMGDMGKLSLDRWGYHTGITSVADKIPTAGENVHDDTNDAAGQLHDQPNVGVAKTGSDGRDVLGYAFSNDMMTVSLSASAANAGSEESAAITINAIEGLSIGGAIGTNMNDTAGRTSEEDDLTTMFAVYTMGPISVGYQVTDIETEQASSDIETDHYGISFAINENLSVSYGEHTVDFEASTRDQESKGFSASYTAGSMSFVLVNNKKENAEGTANLDDEMIELKMIMAF
jgi:outer membrane protein OmpU